MQHPFQITQINDMMTEANRPLHFTLTFPIILERNNYKHYNPTTVSLLRHF